jgi:hypothetical protein
VYPTWRQLIHWSWPRRFFLHFVNLNPSSNSPFLDPGSLLPSSYKSATGPYREQTESIEISGCHGVKYEGDCLLGYCSVQFRIN